MKTTVVSFLLFLGLLCSCGNHEDDDANVIANIKVAISHTDTYRYVATLGDEEGLYRHGSL